MTIIATSREPLGVAGETVTASRRSTSATRPSCSCCGPGRPTAASSRATADGERSQGICRRLDGIPLAIELAAARIRSLRPGELLERLDDRFRLLRSGGRGGLDGIRHCGPRWPWSYQLLSTGCAVCCSIGCRCSLGSFDLAAAEAVCAGDGLDSYDIVDLLGDLVDKSMVVASRSDRGTRYRLLETLRQYGEERLDDRTETTVVRDAHLHHFVEVAQHLIQQWQSPIKSSPVTGSTTTGRTSAPPTPGRSRPATSTTPTTSSKQRPTSLTAGSTRPPRMGHPHDRAGRVDRTTRCIHDCFRELVGDHRR